MTKEAINFAVDSIQRIDSKVNLKKSEPNRYSEVMPGSMVEEQPEQPYEMEEEIKQGPPVNEDLQEALNQDDSNQFQEYTYVSDPH